MTEMESSSAPLEAEKLRWKDRRAFYRRVAIAPICLCLVALFHVYRVRCCEQTPWKGGGFGMFSTVDQGTARYLRVYLLTDEGEIPVAVPPRWQKRAAELCAAPDRAGLKQLAWDLADVHWHDASQRWESIALAAATRDIAPEDIVPEGLTTGDASIEAGTGADGGSLTGAALHRRIQSPTHPSDPFGMPLPIVPVSASDQPSRNLATVRVREVRAELWRYEFDAKKRQLRGKKLLEVATPKQGAA